jgi:hypothetical protein
MTRFGARWMRATEAALPPLDIEKGVERLLRAHPLLVPRRPGRFPLWVGTATLIGIALSFVSIRALFAHHSTGAPRLVTVGIRLSESIADQVLRFSDGSTIILSSDASLGVCEVGEQDSRIAIEIEVDRGSATVDIVPRAGANMRCTVAGREDRIVVERMTGHPAKHRPVGNQGSP